MAYVWLPGKSLGDKTVTAAEIISQMSSMGWSLFDDMTASYYKVMRSNGESGSKQWLYVKIDWSGTYVTINLYGFWNATSHSSTAPAISVSTSITATRILWMYGNKDFVVVVQESAGTLSTHHYFGHVVSLPSTAVNTTTSASITAGSSVVISVASNTGFVVGGKYQIFDPVTGYRQTFICTNIGTDTITADSIATVGYASGSSVGTHVFPVLYGSASIIPAYSMNHHRCTYNAQPTTYSASITATQKDVVYQSLGLPALGYAERRGFFPPVCCETGGDPISYHYLGTMDDGNGYIYFAQPLSSVAFFNDSVTSANFDAIYLGSNDTGSTTGSNTVTTLNDTAKAWTTNQWAGKVLVCTSGSEIGQIRKISSNTATQLTVSPDFNVIPVSGSYVVADKGYRYFTYNSIGVFLREGI